MNSVPMDHSYERQRDYLPSADEWQRLRYKPMDYEVPEVDDWRAAYAQSRRDRERNSITEIERRLRDVAISELKAPFFN